MLGDVDRQRSTVPWLRRRAVEAVAGEPLHGWATDPRNVLRPPPGVRHVVLDTPGGLQGFDLGRVVMYADILLLPMCDSLFDRESASECLEELRAHPRVASGRVQIGMVGMRLEWTRYAEARLRAWATELEVPMVAAIRDSRAFVSAAERGLTILDLPEEQTSSERGELGPLLDWLEGAIAAIPVPTVTRPVQARAARDSAADAAGAAVPPRAPAEVAGSQAAPAAPPGVRPARPAEPAPEAGAAEGSDASAPISLIQVGNQPAGALTQLRRWLGRVRSGP